MGDGFYEFYISEWAGDGDSQPNNSLSISWFYVGLQKAQPNLLH